MGMFHAANTPRLMSETSIVQPRVFDGMLQSTRFTREAESPKPARHVRRVPCSAAGQPRALTAWEPWGVGLNVRGRACETRIRVNCHTQDRRSGTGYGLQGRSRVLIHPLGGPLLSITKLTEG